MKKINKFYFSLVIVLLITNLASLIKIYTFDKELGSTRADFLEAKQSYPDIYNYLNSLTVQKFKKMIDDKENFLVYVGRPTCQDCSNFEPQIISIIKSQKMESQFYYLNVSKLKENESEWLNFKAKYEIIYTPTIAYISDGEVSSKVEWTPEKGMDIEKVKAWLEEQSRDDTN